MQTNAMRMAIFCLARSQDIIMDLLLLCALQCWCQLLLELLQIISILDLKAHIANFRDRILKILQNHLPRCVVSRLPCSLIDADVNLKQVSNPIIKSSFVSLLYSCFVSLLTTPHWYLFSVNACDILLFLTIVLVFCYSLFIQQKIKIKICSILESELQNLQKFCGQLQTVP